jgi:Ca2+:H+ antiporter
VGLIVPAVFSTALTSQEDVSHKVLKISRASSIILLFAYGVYVFFQMRSHKGLYETILHGDDKKDTDKTRDWYKPKLTMTEAVLAIVISITSVSFMAIFLVEKIEFIVNHHHIKDA